MGKSQKKRQIRRHNPVRVPDSHLPKGLSAAQATSSKRDAVLPILQKVQFPFINLTEEIAATEFFFLKARWRAQTLLSANGPVWLFQIWSRMTLQHVDCCREKMSSACSLHDSPIAKRRWSLKPLAPYGRHTIRYISFSSERYYCRNLCIDGGFEICAEMYNKSILTPLKTFVPKVLIMSCWIFSFCHFSLTPGFCDFLGDRSPPHSLNICHLPKMLLRTLRSWYTNLPTMWSQFCGVYRECDLWIDRSET